MGHKRIKSFNRQETYLDHRIDKVKKSLSLNWEDSWALDKNWVANSLDGFYSCKFCAKPLYKSHYTPGVIHVSCKTPLCPGNVDSGMAKQIKEHQFDIRELTNQYLFDSMLRF